MYNDDKHLFTQEGWISSESNREYFYEAGKEITTGCEIGTFKGLSACLIGFHLKDTPGGKYYCIDTFESTGNDQKPEYTFPEWKKNIDDAGLSDVCVPIKGWSTDKAVIAKIPDELDFIFVDGDHTADAVYADAVTYWPKLRSGGRMAFHDSTWDSVKEGIARFAKETPSAKKIRDIDD